MADNSSEELPNKMMMVVSFLLEAGAVGYVPPSDEMSEVVSHCLSHRQLWVNNLCKHGASAVDISGNTVTNSQSPIDSYNPNSFGSDSKPDNDDGFQAIVPQLPVLAEKDVAQMPIVQQEDMEVGLMDDGIETVESIKNALELPTEESMAVPINSPQQGTLSPCDAEHSVKEISESRTEEAVESIENALELPTEELMAVPINSPLRGTLSPCDAEHNVKENSDSLSESRTEETVESIQNALELPTEELMTVPINSPPRETHSPFDAEHHMKENSASQSESRTEEAMESIENALELPTEELMAVPINSPLRETLSPFDAERNMKEYSELQSESRTEDCMEISEEILHVPNLTTEGKGVMEELLITEKNEELADQDIIGNKEAVSGERSISDKELPSSKEDFSCTNLINEQEVNTISGVCAESLIDNFVCSDQTDAGVDSLTAVPSVVTENSALDEIQQAIDVEPVEVLPELDTYSAQNVGDKGTESFEDSEEKFENAETEPTENDSSKQCTAEKLVGSIESNNSRPESTPAEMLESCGPSDTKQIPSSSTRDKSMENAGSSMENASCNSNAEKFDHAANSEHSESQNSLTTVDIEMADADDNNVGNSSPVNQNAEEDNQVQSIMATDFGTPENSNKAMDRAQCSGDEQAEGNGRIHKVEENSTDTASEEESRRPESKQPGLDGASDKTSGKENEDENGKDSEDSKANITMLKAKEEKSAQGSQNSSEETSCKSANDALPSVNKSQQKTAKSAQQSKAAKHQECVVCKKVTKCKYNIVRNDDTKHLCDDKCFQMFRSQPTAYLQSDAKKAGATTAEACNQCHKTITASAKGKHTLKTGKDNQKFCSATCLNSFWKQIKPCASCGKDLRTDLNAFVAPVDGEGYKDFCGHACLVKYEHSKKQTTKDEEEEDDDVEIVEATPAPKSKSVSGSRSSGRSKCVICTKLATVRHEANYKSQIHKLCSDACLSAFRVMHNLSLNLCDNCCSMFSLDGTQVQTIQFEGSSKTFCSNPCLSEFKTKKQRLVQCTWCNTCKSNFDMVERLDANSKYQMFCSLNCLSLYRVNLQANSNQSVACDQCHKRAPAQYHLTMSDASVRNFCGYSCVVAFQAQFSQPSTTSGQLPMPGNQVTANTANTQPAQSAVAATPPKRQSHYGTRHSSRVAAQSTLSPVAAPPTPMPVISNIVSLAAQTSASPTSQLTDASKAPAKSVGHIGVQTMAPQEVIVQPPPPKQVKNKALLCKPYMQTKATSCRPHTVGKGCQTEENWEPKKMLVPCPVPTVTPAPMMMFSSPAPYPILIPIPVPIPVFIPTTKKSAAGIMKKIKELQERVPSDPFEAELLMMAEAVANANRTSENLSDSDDEDNDAGSTHLASADNSVTLPPVHSSHQATNGELAEDMLQMALRMAEMQSEPNLDLEDAVDPTPIRARESHPVVSMPVFDTIAADDILQASHMIATPRGGSTRGRGKRRGGSRGGRGASVAKKLRVDEETAETAPAQVMTSPVVSEPPADANSILKFTYGVNAYKHWAIQKNAQIERVAPPKTGSRQRLFKLDLLQCSADELNYALCLFVKEVRKPNGEEYAPDSIFYLCLGIQEYLYENGRIDNIFTDFFYEKFTEILNEVLSHYEVRLNAQGMLVCRIEEEHLWEAKQLGAHSPHVLLNTLIYFNTKHFMLRTAEEHLGLSFSHIMKHWKKTSTPAGKPGRSVYLRYYAPSQSGTGEAAAQKRKKEDLPVFEQAENVENPLRCPVKLYEFYLSKCPESIKNRSDVFYLVPERSCVPDSPVWYSTLSLGVEGMTRMLNRLRVVREIQESQLTSLSVPYYN